jgi:hypothetical protein
MITEQPPQMSEHLLDLRLTAGHPQVRRLTIIKSVSSRVAADSN